MVIYEKKRKKIKRFASLDGEEKRKRERTMNEMEM